MEDAMIAPTSQFFWWRFVDWQWWTGLWRQWPYHLQWVPGTSTRAYPWFSRSLLIILHPSYLCRDWVGDMMDGWSHYLLFTMKKRKYWL